MLDNSQLKLSPLLLNLSKQIAEAIIRRSPFPLNVNIVTVTELHQAINEHVNLLRREREKARNTQREINFLQEVEVIFVSNLQKIELLRMLYEGFWEEEVSDSLKVEKTEVTNEYLAYFEELKKDVEGLSDFQKLERRSAILRSSIEKCNRKADRIIDRYKELFDDVKLYAKIGLSSVERMRGCVVPKLLKSNKLRIKEILNELSVLYEWTLKWIESAVEQILKETSPPKIPKSRTTILEEERKLREALIKEIKDLNEQEIIILMEVAKLSALKRQWLPLAETSEALARETGLEDEEVEKILLRIAEKGFLTLAITF